MIAKLHIAQSWCREKEGDINTAFVHRFRFSQQNRRREEKPSERLFISSVIAGGWFLLGFVKEISSQTKSTFEWLVQSPLEPPPKESLSAHQQKILRRMSVNASLKSRFVIT